MSRSQHTSTGTSHRQVGGYCIDCAAGTLRDCGWPCDQLPAPAECATIAHEQATLLRRPLVLLQGLIVSLGPRKIVCD